MEPVSYYWHEGDWNVPRIFRTIPMPFAQIICQIPIAAGQGDKIVWTESSTGDFSTKSAWEAIRQASSRWQLLADVWHRSLRPPISVFLWRLFQDRIPMDTQMRQKGFSFPSKSPSPHTVCSTDLNEHTVEGRFTSGCRNGFHILPASSSSPRIVRWRAPSPSRFKLNIDGSSIGNPGLAGATGIIRDLTGHVHIAYQFALGTGTSVLAKLTAVWQGMELALTYGLAPLVVEVDATTVISLLKSRASGKEANSAADHLAKEAASLQLTRVLHHDDITGVLRGILCLDRQGVPHLRRG
ncbi:UNVERIFIED_CONTAM: putative ribonuclease H protein [Sesamum calycinum]|uniref:Ribonuclease H protein n=1 Tax=Sesamum calycinum TaxID=2727403 RepID=A0AAW2SFV4_9LAMI